MKRVDSVVKDIYAKLTDQFKIAFISAIVFGFIAHIYMFTNKLPNFDDIAYMNKFGTTFRYGRWFLWVLGATAYHLEFVFSLPWMNGLLTLLTLAVSAGIIAELLGLKTKVANGLLGAALIVFPSWTTTFFYMFTAPYYGFAVLLAVLSVYFVVRHKRGIILSSVLLACSLGIYQAYLPFTATLYVVLLFAMLYEHYNYAEILKRSLYYLFSLATGVICYFILMRLSLLLTGQELTVYKGISSMGKMSLARIPELMHIIWNNFFGIFLNNNLEISYNLITKGMYLSLFIICGVLIATLIIKNIKDKAYLKGIEVIVLTLVFIVAINSIYIMCEEGIYSIMYYSYAFLLIFPLVLIDRTIEWKESGLTVGVEYIGMLILCVGVFSYCHFANAQYLSLHLSYEQSYSFCNTLITQIKSTEGYKDDMPVVLAGEKFVDDSLYHNEVMSAYAISGKDDALIDAYSRHEFFWFYCGFDARFMTVGELSDAAQMEIDKMPNYPNEGSIKIIDGVIVVKAGD